MGGPGPFALLGSLSAALALAQPAAHVPPYPRSDLAIGYKADPSWPKEKPPGGEWGAMSSVAIGPDGNIWTFNRGKIPVQVFSPDGKLVTSWGQDGLFKNPHTIRFDSAGGLWIVDTGTQTVRKFTLDGKVLMTIGTPNQAGADQTHMNQPNDVAFASNGDVYVSDGYGNDRVVVFDKIREVHSFLGQARHGSGRIQPAAFHRARLQGSRVRRRSQQRPHPGLRFQRQVPDGVEKHHHAVGAGHHGERRNLCLRKFSHVVVGNPGEPGGAGHAPQGSALHEARYGRAAASSSG